MENGVIILAGAIGLIVLVLELVRHRKTIGSALNGELAKEREVRRLRLAAIAELEAGNERAAMMYTEQADQLDEFKASDLLSIRRVYNPDDGRMSEIYVPTVFQ